MRHLAETRARVLRSVGVSTFHAHFIVNSPQRLLRHTTCLADEPLLGILKDPSPLLVNPPLNLLKRMVSKGLGNGVQSAPSIAAALPGATGLTEKPVPIVCVPDHIQVVCGEGQ